MSGIAVKAYDRYCRALFALLMLLCPISAVADDDVILSVQVANVVEFVSWPEEKAPVLCVYANGAVFGNLSYIATKRKGFKVRKLVLDKSLDGCNAIYLENLSHNNLRAILHKANSSKNILTISNADGFEKNNGIVGIRKYKNKIRIYVNVNELHEAGLQADPNFLSIVEVVGEELL